MRKNTMSVKEANKIFDKIENRNYKKYGKILSCAMKLIYYAGLKKTEIPKLTIDDVYEQDGTVRVEVETVDPKIPLQTNIRLELLTYHDYLKLKCFSTTPTDPLFPGYYSDSNDHKKELKKIIRHLKIIDPDYNNLIHDLHKMGIKDLKQQGFSKEYIAAQFRISEISVQNSIGGTIPLPGDKPLEGVNLLNNQMVKLIDRLTILDYTDIKIIKDNIDNYYNEITSLPDKNLKKLGQGSKVGAFNRYLIELLKEWK
jgi:hypothetical protein